jgi:hypothetical protein
MKLQRIEKYIQLNAYYGTANGSEVLYQSEKGKVIAARISSKIAELGFKDRGPKPNSMYKQTMEGFKDSQPEAPKEIKPNVEITEFRK